MNKLYAAILLLLFICGFNNVFAQVPNISYNSSSQSLTTGKPINITVTNTGGAIPTMLYGRTTTFAGAGYAGSANGAGATVGFNSPLDLAFDKDGVMFVSDLKNATIRKIQKDATVNTTAGSQTTGFKDTSGYYALFRTPAHIRADNAGNIYINDQANYRIRKLDANNNVTTLVGDGTSGRIDATGTAARINFPQGMAIDAAGNLYITDNSTFVRKITPAGVVTTIAGSTTAGYADGPVATAQFGYLVGIAVDKDGNIFVADNNNGCIRKIGTDGIVSTYAGSIKPNVLDANGPLLDATFFQPLAMVFDSNGNLFISQSDNVIRKITPAGDVSTLVGTSSQSGHVDGVGASVRFKGIYGINVDAVGNLFAADQDNNQIRKVETMGFTVSPALPAGLSIDSTGAIVGTPATISAPVTYTVTAYNSVGSSSTTITLTINSTPVISNFAPRSANVSSLVTITGKYFTGATAVTFGGVAAATYQVVSDSVITATLSAGTQSGDVGITTRWGTTIQAGFKFYTQPVISYPTPPALIAGVPITPIKITRSGGDFPQTMYGKVTVIAGSGKYGSDNGAATAASFANPLGVGNDKTGNVYVAEANNNTIRKIATDGTVTTFAGNGTGGYVDGPANTAQFKYPTGIAVNKTTGDVYVADRGNNMVRKITPAGVVSTVAPGESFIAPYGLAIDPQGVIYVADSYRNVIKKIAVNGTVSVFAGSGHIGNDNGVGTAATFNVPYAVTLDAAGNLYVGENGSTGGTRKITPGGTVSSYLSSATSTTSLAVDELNNVYITGDLSLAVMKAPPGAQSSTYFAGRFNTGNSLPLYQLSGPDTLARLGVHAGIAYDGDGNLLVADQGSSTIKKVSLTGYYIDEYFLPKGLFIDYITGSIVGTPLVVTAPTVYHISAYNNGAVGSTTITLSVVPGTQTLTFDPVPTKTYGDADFSPATSNNTGTPITYTTNNSAILSIVNNQLHIVGAGTAIVTATQPTSTSFTAATPITQTITIKPAELTVGVINSIRTFGKADPKFYLSFAGFVNGEDTLKLTKVPIATTTTNTTTVAGDYPITISGGVANNYTFKYTPGTMTIFPVPVITASGPLTFRSGSNVVLNAIPATGYVYQWYKDGIAITTGTTASYTATETGYYAVSIKALTSAYTTFSDGAIVTKSFYLPPTNFKLTITSTTCKGSNNGSINITAEQTLNYVAAVTLGGVTTQKPFTKSLDLTGLTPGNYSICISVTGEIYSQCYSTNVTEPKDLAVYTAVNKNANQLTVSLDGGTQYNITLNGQNYTTTASTITLPLSSGNNKLSVTTDKLCQGVMEKTIILADKIIPYPDPFQNTLNVNLGDNAVTSAKLTIHSAVDGKLVYSGKYVNQSGVIQLDVSKLNNGLYVLYLTLDNNADLVFKLLKK
jgi:sugar lactone lactonase YvrE